MNAHDFWKMDLGNVLTLIGLVFTIVALHRSNVERIQRMETKLDLLYNWFQSKVINGSGNICKNYEEEG